MMEAFVQFLMEWGYWGLFFAAFIAGSIVPLSSEVVMLGLVALGLDPVWCVVVATIGNTLGTMTCYGLGRLGKPEWITKLGVSEEKIEKARKFLAGRGAMMAFFCFLPTIGEAIAITLGLMRSNIWLTAGSMFVGKAIRYIFVMLLFKGAVSLFF